MRCFLIFFFFFSNCHALVSFGVVIISTVGKKKIFQRKIKAE